MSDKLIPFTGLWEHTSKKGELYLAGNVKLGLGNYRLLVFPAAPRISANPPAMMAYLTPLEPEKKTEPWEDSL